VQTDDHPIVPYTTRFTRGRRMQPSLLLAVRSPVVPFLHGLGPQAAALREALGQSYEAQGLVLAGQLDRALARRPEGGKLRLFAEQSRTVLPYYTALAERYPDDADKQFEAGTQLAQLGFPKAARPVFERALQLRPGDFRLRLNLALLLRDLGEPDRAIEMLAALRAEQPGSAVVLYNLGTAELAAGDAGTAVGHFREALGWDPDSLSARLALSQAYLEQGQLDRAAHELEELLRRNWWVAEAHDLLGLLAGRRGAHQQSVRHHTQALRQQPHRAQFHYNLGVALQAGQALDRAEVAYQAALELDPQHAEAANNLGLVYAAQGRFEAAADRYLQALDSDPGYAAAAHNLGLALSGQGRPSEAIDAFCLALRLRPDLVSARRQIAQLGGDPERCGH